MATSGGGGGSKGGGASKVKKNLGGKSPFGKTLKKAPF